MTGAQFSDTSSVTTEVLAMHGVELGNTTLPHGEVVSCWVDADLETSTSLDFMEDGHVTVVTEASLAAVAAELLDDRLPMSTMTVWFPIFVAKTVELDEDDVLLICGLLCVVLSADDGFATVVDNAEFCGRSTENWLLDRDGCASLDTLYNEGTQTTDCGDNALTTLLHCDKPADTVLMHLLFSPTAETGCVLHITVLVMFFVRGTTTTSITARELPETTLLFPPTTK